jgi:hypothetical protein
VRGKWGGKGRIPWVRKPNIPHLIRVRVGVGVGCRAPYIETSLGVSVSVGFRVRVRVRVGVREGRLRIFSILFILEVKKTGDVTAPIDVY